MKDTIGKPTNTCKIAAGLFWADYGVLGAQVEELTAAGVDWIHIEMRDGKYMDFAAPRGGYDIIEATRAHTDLEVEVQLQMWRPSMDLYKQLADLGVNLITLPLETTGEMTAQHLTYIQDLGLKIGVWAWQGTPIVAFEQYIDWVDIIEYECRAPFWKPLKGAQSPHVMDPIMVTNIQRMRDMVKAAGRVDRSGHHGRRRLECRQCRRVHQGRHDGWRIFFAAAQGAEWQAQARHRRHREGREKAARGHAG